MPSLLYQTRVALIAIAAGTAAGTLTTTAEAQPTSPPSAFASMLTETNAQTQQARATAAAQPIQMMLRGPGRTLSLAVESPDAATSLATLVIDGQPEGAANGYTVFNEVHVIGIPADELRALPGVVRVTSPPFAPQLQRVRVATVRAAQTLADRLAADARAETIELSIEGPRVTRSVPTDPNLPQQWHLINTQFGIADANIEPAWQMGYSGMGVTIGVIEGGFQITHPDLAPNYFAEASQDGDSISSHATSVAGVAAARGNNGQGGAGAAFNANLSELDWTPASNAFTHRTDLNDIMNNSWGLGDQRSLYDISSLDRLALKDGWENGRDGKGVLYVWAAGNGGLIDRTDYDGYANSRFTFAIGAIGDFDSRSSFNERGSSILAVAHSSGNNRGVWTTSSNNGYTSGFGGTSSAAPLASGIFALVLEANPSLTARDVKHIVVNSARTNDSTNSLWTTNAAGHDFNDNYGHGALDAGAMINLALTWENVGPEVEIPSSWIDANVAVPDNNASPTLFDVEISENILVETVELLVEATVANAGDIQLELVSPEGTVSPLMTPRTDNTNNIDHRFMTNRAWDEESAGTWSVRMADRVAGPSGQGGATIDRVRLRIYGRDIPAAACEADWNNDQSVNVLDVIAFITNWNAMGEGADFNDDASINILDVIAFITTWNAGCP